MLLRAAEIARNDRKCVELGVAREVALSDVHERTNDDMPAVVGDELRRHGLELAAKEEIQEKRCQQIVAMMAKRDLCRAQLAGDAIENAATQARAE